MLRSFLIIFTFAAVASCGGGGGGSKDNVASTAEDVVVSVVDVVDKIEIEDIVVEVVEPVEEVVEEVVPEEVVEVIVEVVEEVEEVVEEVVEPTLPEEPEDLGVGNLTFHTSEFAAFIIGESSNIPVTISGLEGQSFKVSLFGLYPDWLTVDEKGTLQANAPVGESPGLLNIKLRVDMEDGSYSSPFINLPLIDQATLQDAHRLLRQATFGVTEESLQEVLVLGVEGWIDQQLAMPLPEDHSADGSIDAKTHLQRMEEIAYEAQPSWYGKPDHRFVANQNYLAKYYQDAAMLEKIFDGKDQLRQRAAYALSQQWVVSANSIPLSTLTFMVADYYDLMVKYSLGDYRQMMADVTLSPAMGLYLSHQGNRAASDSVARPDENYARELQQLFTIGVYQLDENGQAIVDSNGQPVPSYTQQDVEEMARVLTGLDLVKNKSFGSVGDRETDYLVPMEFNSAFYDSNPKTLYGVTLNESGTTGTPSLDHALDLMFEHNNTAFVIARHMIQRMVSSNPTQEYVARVAAVFNDDGTGKRGNMAAMIRALLLDEEARAPIDPNKGKAQEPALLFTGLARAFNVKPRDGWRSPENKEMNGVYIYRDLQVEYGHWPLRSGSVFNFYQDDYIPMGAPFSEVDGVAQGESLAAPELQLFDFTQNIDFHNAIYNLVRRSVQASDLYAGGFENANSKLTVNSIPLLAIDYERVLGIFETAMDLEEQANGSYSLRDSTSRDNNGRTPKERGIDAVLEYFDYLFYAKNMPENYRLALKSAMNEIEIGTEGGIVKMVYTAIYGLSVSSMMREQY